MKLIARLSRIYSLSIIALMISTIAAVAQAPARLQPPESLSASEFSRLINEISEESGYFRSDNFTSNETSYLTVVDKLRQLGASGGAYIGVGPEQNFTYIAKIRPRIAFIIDIRRQAIIQHLMYKAVFHQASSRAQFLSLLLSRPLPKEKPFAADVSTSDLLNYFTKIAPDEQYFSANLAMIRKTIRDDFQFQLTERDQANLEYVYKSFRDDGLDIAYRMEGSRGGYFPTLKDLIAQTDLNGKLGNFFAVAEDYEFVRNLHRKNLIVPVVGDFGGNKALAAIGAYLKKHGLTVTAYYTSNVEQYLFDSDSFSAFANNVRKLPLDDRSLFIRAVTGRYSHPARLPEHRSATILQKMTVFLKDFDAGVHTNYREMVMSNYISADRQ